MIEGWTLTAAAEAAGVSVRCARKWVGRYRVEGELGLLDRSSAPRRVANRTAAERVEVIVKLRRLRMTAAEIAETLGMPLSTVSGILTRIGMGRLGRLGLEPAGPLRALPAGRARPRRRQEARPDRTAAPANAGATAAASTTPARYTDAAGRCARKAGWEYVHIAVDDYSRLAYAEVLPDEKATTAIGFLRRAVAFYRRYGIRVERRAHRQRPRLHLDHARARLPHASASDTSAPAPTDHRQTAKPNASSARCSTAGPTAPSTAQATNAPTALDGWLWHYNHQRRHSALGHQPPVTRTNLLGSYI